MHRGFMNMFPDVGAVGGGGQDPNLINKDQQKPQGANTKEEVSVFSSYDGNKDAKINYQEATSTSIFGATQVKDPGSNIKAPTQTSDGKEIDQNKFQSIMKFDLNKAGEKALKNAYNSVKGNLSHVVTKLTIESPKSEESGGSDRQAKMNDASQALDQRVSTSLSGAMNQVNANLMTAYQEAIQSALTEYEAQQAQENGDSGKAEGEEPDVKNGKDNSSVDPTTVSKDDFDTSSNPNAKTDKITVNSTYDNSPKDEKVNYQEMSGSFKFNNRVQVLTDNKDALSAVGDINAKGQQMFTEALQTFSANVGSKTIKGKNAQDASKLADATNKLNQKAESAATNAQRKANDQVNQSLQKEVNQTISNTLNGVKSKEPEKEAQPTVEKPTSEETEQTPVEKEQTPVEKEDNKGVQEEPKTKTPIAKGKTVGKKTPPKSKGVVGDGPERPSTEIPGIHAADLAAASLDRILASWTKDPSGASGANGTKTDKNNNTANANVSDGTTKTNENKTKTRTMRADQGTYSRPGIHIAGHYFKVALNEVSGGRPEALKVLQAKVDAQFGKGVYKIT